MPLGAHAVPGNGMIKAVFDANVLVSASSAVTTPEEFQANSSILLSQAPSTFICPSKSSTR